MTERTLPTPGSPQIPGLKPDEAFAGADGGPSVEQIQRMHEASSARLQAAMDAPQRKPPAPTPQPAPAPLGPGEAVSFQEAASQALGGAAPPPTAAPPGAGTPVVGVIKGVPGFDVSPYQAVIDHGDEVEFVLPGGRRSRATKEQLRERLRVVEDMKTQNVRWEQENRAKYGPKVDSAWDIPAPAPEKLTGLAVDDPKHRCTTCKHSVMYVIGYASASGFSHHHVSRSFCALIEDPEGGNLEFEDSPIYYCSHHETRWATWARFQLSRLEKRVLGSTGKIARVLKVIRDDGKGNGSTHG